MRKLMVVFIVFIFVFATVPSFAEELKRFEQSPFNILKDWFASFGKRVDGRSMMEIKNRPSWLPADEVKERRRSIGVKRGMGEYE